MAEFDGASSMEIHVAIDDLFALLADVERVPEWQPDVKVAECLERDAPGRPVLVRTELETAIRTTQSIVRFRYQPPHVISWVMEEGDVKAFHGSWTLAELGDGGTRAEYAVNIDFGRGLGMLVRGPAGKALKGAVVSTMPAKLKVWAEAEAPLLGVPRSTAA